MSRASSSEESRRIGKKTWLSESGFGHDFCERYTFRGRCDKLSWLDRKVRRDI